MRENTMQWTRKITGALLPLFATGLLSTPALAEEDDGAFNRYRAAMVEAIEHSVEETREYTGIAKLNPRVTDVMRRVPRHRFVPEDLVPLAYLNRPLPVGHGQKISQPFIVALMTDLAALKPNDRVLVLGAGGGYHAAVVSLLSKDVRCVEMIEPVAEAAMKRLSAMDYANVEIRVADPYYGWPGPDASFDAIIVRLSMEFVPRALIAQLKPGGRLVMPLGNVKLGQNLVVVTKKKDGGTSQRRVLPVMFTRMPGGPRI